ncbi:MAG: hypothetical protein ACTSQU_18965 [Promethearchaeota archaeon]
MIKIRKVLHLPVDKLKNAGIILSKAFNQDYIFSHIIPDTKQRLKTLNLYFQHMKTKVNWIKILKFIEFI